jgi:hypothetical protein
MSNTEISILSTSTECNECGAPDSDECVCMSPEELAELEKEMEYERELVAEGLVGGSSGVYIPEPEPYFDDYQDNWLDDGRFGMVGE